MKGTLIRQRLLLNTASNFASRFFTLALGFLLTPFILYRLGAVEYGLWMLVSAVVAYGSLFDLGIAGAVIKYVAEHRARGENEAAHHLIATALTLYTLLGLMAAALGVILAPLFPMLFQVPANERDTSIALVILSGLTLGISIPCTLTVAILRGLQRFDAVNLITSIGTSLQMAGTVAVLLLGGGVLGLVAVNIPVMLTMQALSLRLIRRIAPELKVGWSGARRSFVSKILSFSAALFVIDIASRLQSKTDGIVIGAILPISTVTPYALAQRLSEIPQMLTDQFMRLLLPLASQLHAEQDHGRLRVLYVVSTRLSLACFMPIGITIILLARSILTAWVGPAYADYSPLVVILILATMIETSQWPAGSILQGMARHRFLAITSSGSGLANLALSIILIHPLGLAGVAVGTLIPTTIECFALVIPYSMRVLDIRAAEILKEIILPVVMPVIPMAITLYYLVQVIDASSWFSLSLLASAGLFVYAACYFLLGASSLERQTCQMLITSTVQFLNAQFKRI